MSKLMNVSYALKSTQIASNVIPLASVSTAMISHINQESNAYFVTLLIYSASTVINNSTAPNVWTNITFKRNWIDQKPDASFAAKPLTSVFFANQIKNVFSAKINSCLLLIKGSVRASNKKTKQG